MPSPEPLSIKHYRRHRTPSVWGAASLATLGLTLLWCVFWYLMMNQRQIGEPGPNENWQGQVLVGGAAGLAVLGALLAALGLFDAAHRRGRAAVALVLNLLVLIVLGLIVSSRLLMQK